MIEKLFVYFSIQLSYKRSYAISVTTESFFQLRISPVDDCVSWTVSEAYFEK
jgi:hypothetical protein